MVRSSSDKRKFSAEKRPPVRILPRPLGMRPIAAVPLSSRPPAKSAEELYEERCMMLIKLLHSCADAAAKEEVALLSTGLEQVNSLASADGEPIQRLASAFADALALRVVQPMRGVCRALQLTSPLPRQVSAAARHYYDALLPFLRLAAAAANSAIIEAMEHEMGDVHVVDLGGAGTGQWLELVRLFAARPEGPPRRLRITVMNDQDEFLTAAAALLAAEAERFRVRLRFNPVKSNIDELRSFEPLGIRDGEEALVVTSTLQLHRLLAFKLDDDAAMAAAAAHDRKGKTPVHAPRRTVTTTRADALLRALRVRSPRLVVLTEQEADHNRTEFKERFANALAYYAALFDALEERAPRSSPERHVVERLLLREEIRDVVASDDGGDALRRERHEKMELWAARLGGAGFAPVAMSYNALVQTARMAQQLSGAGGGGTLYRVSRDNGCFFLYWRATPMFSVSTWTPAAAARGGLADEARWPAGPSSSAVAATPRPDPVVVVLD